MKLLEVARIERCRVGRNHGQDGLHEPAHRNHHLREFFVRFGVHAGVPANLANGFGVVVHAPQVITVGHRRERAVERQDFQPVPWQVELPDDLRPQQRDHVRTLRKQEPGKNLFCHCGAAQHVPALENDDFLPCFCKIRGIDQPIVAAADDDHVVVLPHAVRLR